VLPWTFSGEMATAYIANQTLTGKLPFAAVDPMEWVHCHIAKNPEAPQARCEDIPPQLSSIVMKLLAKTPDERYQTALGLERDLRRCLADWETHGAIAEFPLGERDTAERLMIPEQLYGRENEVERLVTALDNVLATGTRARARLRKSGNRQVFGHQRASQGAGPSARPFCVGQVRPTEAGRSLRHFGRGVPESGSSPSR
jgi:serine/threonine protein kinase